VARLTSAMAELTQTSRAAGAPLAVVALGDPTQSLRPTVLAEALDGLGLPWLDGRSWLDQRADGALPLIPGELHFTAASNGEAAERIAVWLAGSGLLDAGQR